MLKSALGAKEEKPLGRRDKWTKGAYKELEERRKRGKKYSALFRKLDNEDVVEKERSYPYTKSRYNDVVFANPGKKRLLPTVAHNYSSWADLIFALKSRERGMLLIVEETSRWCWCHSFFNKSSFQIW